MPCTVHGKKEAEDDTTAKSDALAYSAPLGSAAAPPDKLIVFSLADYPLLLSRWASYVG
jgi:hypothetical protein